MDIDRHLIAGIKGFLAEEEGMCLYETALEASRMGPCLEIGGYCGKSTVYLGAACKETNSILFSVDHHRGSEEQQPGEEYFDPDLYDPSGGHIDTFKEFRNTIDRCGISDSVVPIVCRSELAARLWGTSLSLVFIDGGHAYESVSTDYQAWTSHIMANGYLLFHDIILDPAEGGQGPFQVYSIAKASGIFQEIALVGTLGVLRRVKDDEHVKPKNS